MAGGVPKTLGLVLTLVALVALVGGLGVAMFGASQVEAETRKTFPDDDRAEAAAEGALAGLAVAGLAAAVLLLALPLLVWGFHRQRDEDGRVRTRRGGALTAWTVAFLVVGALFAAVGAGAATYGGAIGTERGSLFGGGARQELSEGLVAFGSVLLVVGVVLFALGLVFGLGATLRGWDARRRPTGSGPAQATTSPAATPEDAPAATSQAAPAAATTTPRRASPAFVAAVMVAGVVLLALLGVALVGETPGAFALDTNADQSEQRRSFEGQLRGVPGSVGLAQPRAVHEMAPEADVGHFSALLTWGGGAAPPETLVLALEVWSQERGWIEVAREEGPSALLASAPGALAFEGNVRVVVSAPEGLAADTDYQVELVVRAA